MFKQFIMKKAVEAQLKDAPPETKAKILSAVEKNPELFERLALEIKVATDSGKDQMTAMKEVMEKNRNELAGILK